MSKLSEMVGKKFGRLEVLSLEWDDSHRRTMALCACDCGNLKSARPDKIRSGAIRSCGCLQVELTIQRSTKHGLTGRCNHHPIYNSWRGMRERCESPRHKDYHNYGARGIVVCDRWMDLGSFAADMMPTWFDGATLERIDVNGNYEPGNCKWATWAEQGRNKRNNATIIYHGKPVLVLDAARMAGLSYNAFHHRLQHGWTPDEAIETPFGPRNIPKCKRVAA